MLSKRERFQQWRGIKSDDELQILEVALLISEYVNSVDRLEIIKADAESKFSDFNQDNSRSWATAVFTKLFIDEAIAQLPETAAQERALLIHLSTILTQLYENWKKDTAQNVTLLIDTIEKLIAINTIPFTDKKHYKTFLFSSYMLFNIIRLSLNELNWSMQMMASLIIDIEQMKLKITYFLEKIEEKEHQLGQIENREAGTDKTENDPLNSIKILLNKRYFKVLSQTPLLRERTQTAFLYPIEIKPKKKDILASLTEFEADIDRVSSGIERLIELRNKKAEIEVKIENINKLIAAAQDNERKITGRKYFLDFITSHSQLYQTLLENTEGVVKLQLLEKKDQLEKAIESPDLSSGVVNGLSWVASPLTIAYRTATPQMIQEAFSSTLPATLDSDCKIKLKELAQICMSDLKKQLEKKENQIIAINNRFFNQDEKIKQLITHESSEQLAVLQKANDALKEAVQANTKLVVHIKENLHFLNDLKSMRETLNEFIRLHDTILVKICNFLSQFFSFFKTEKVQMIDEASTLKKQVNKLAAEYQNSIDQQMLQMEQNPFFDEKIKNHIKRRLKAEDRDMNLEKKNCIAPDRQNVRLLMDNLSDLFAKNIPPAQEHLEEAPITKESILVFS
ncbi:purine NTPase [Legionella sainthelensi]|uniref:Purine NTPase n=1 Tax=Legionella sainthelensi TaxID=28087 RepID=A0A0W0YD54_9GAMM|nr:hypothetical protein [Legionella sainthelensi]KTD54639.1 purine NTPase [Legionella sainthelensi]VEH30311.1 purine NTPase, putative [Legionella sainthelensi]